MAQKVINLGEKNSLIGSFVAQTRSVEIQKDRMRFRRNMERIGEVIAYEISKKLSYTPQEVVTPLGIADAALLTESPILGTILRAGLTMHNGLLNYFDDADNAFVSAYRQHHKDGSFEIKLEYVSCPSIDGRDLILCDPMLATGASLELTIKELLKQGKPKSLHIATAIASTEGIEHLKKQIKSFTLWTAAIDDELTGKGYIVPGLGDAGDLSYGNKLQD